MNPLLTFPLLTFWYEFHYLLNLDYNYTFPVDLTRKRNSVWCQINWKSVITIQI